MTVITVNKVQDVYDTPVYEFKSEGQTEEDDVLEIMNQCMRDSVDLDIDGYYARQLFNSVHIGDFKIKPVRSELTTRPRVAILMPIYNDCRFLVDAIESILNQTYENILLVIIDDGSSNS